MGSDATCKKIVRTPEDADDLENWWQAGALLGGREGLGDLLGVFEEVADLLGVHLGDRLFRHAESEEALALLELAAALCSGGLAGTDFIIFDLGAFEVLHDGEWFGVGGGLDKGWGAAGQAEKPDGVGGGVDFPPDRGLGGAVRGG